jgi:hypothetical protein
MQIPYKWVAIGLVAVLCVAMLGNIRTFSLIPQTQNITANFGVTGSTNLGTTTMLAPTDIRASYVIGQELEFTMNIKTTTIPCSSPVFGYSLVLNKIVITMNDKTRLSTVAEYDVLETIVATQYSTETVSNLWISTLIPTVFQAGNLDVQVSVSYKWIILTKDPAGRYVFVEGLNNDLRVFTSTGFTQLIEPTPTQPDGNTLTLYIRNEGGPISGASVRLTGPMNPPTQLSGGTGFVQFLDLDAGDYRIAVTSTSGNKVQNINLIGSTIITIYLSGGAIVKPGYGTIQGTTHSQDGNVPLAGVTVSATDAAGHTRSITSDSNSDYYLASLPVGVYTVEATYLPYHSATHIISVSTNAVVIQNFLILNAAATLTITVKDAVTKNTITGAELIMNGGVYHTAQGIIQINDWVAGVYTYSISHQDYNSITSTFNVARGVNVFTILMTAKGALPVGDATISGKITKVGTTDPIMNAIIHVGSFTTLSLTDGSYSILVPAGSYSIEASAVGFNTTHYAQNPLTVVDGDVKTGINIQMPIGGGGNDDTTPTDWLPTIILGAIGGVIFLLGIIGYSTRSNPVYLFLGFCALAICLIVGLMLTFNLISFDSGAVITGAVAWWK